MKLKLIKGRSYSAKNIRVTSDKPIYETDDSKLITALIGSGYFVAVADNLGDSKSSIKPAPLALANLNNEIPLEKMTGIRKANSQQLDEYAKANGIDLKGLTKNADKAAKIQQVIAEMNLTKSNYQTETDADSDETNEDKLASQVSFDGEV